MTLHHLAGFYGPWSLALAASTAEPVPMGATILHFEGIDLPLVQAVLAIAGVLMARPLAPRRDQERGVLRQILVTLIMMVIAVAWVSESRPGVLFTFVVAIGLGFSGYSLIELAGKEIESVVKRLFATVADRISNIAGGRK